MIRFLLPLLLALSPPALADTAKSPAAPAEAGIASANAYATDAGMEVPAWPEGLSDLRANLRDQFCNPGEAWLRTRGWTGPATPPAEAAPPTGALRPRR